MWAMVHEGLLARLREDARVVALADDLEKRLRAGETTATLAAGEILGMLGAAAGRG